MLIIFKKSADVSGIVGWLIISIIALLAFQTSLEVIFRSTLAGLIKSFPVSLIVATSLLQMAFMEKTGALKRVIIFIKTISSDNKAVQIMLINIGFGTLMVAVGATPVSLLPPILLAMGYSTYAAIALPAIGYDSLCTYALLGAPVVAFLGTANNFFGEGQISLSQIGSIFFYFLPVVSTLIGFCMLWIAGKWQTVRQGFIPCLVTGATIGVVSYFTNKFDNLVLLTGVLCGIAVIAVMVLYLKATGKKVIDRSKLTPEDLDYEKKYPLWKALMPWIILIAAILLINVPKDMFNFFFGELTLEIPGISADNKPIVTRALWNAYTWIFVSVLLAIPFLKPNKDQMRDTLKVWLKRAPRPVFSAAIFFAIGEIMNMSGFGTWEKLGENIVRHNNMVKVLADFSADMFNGAYIVIVSFIGLFGGFITGSEASTIGMFANYAMATGKNLNYSVNGIILLTAALAFGGGLASVISPAKLQNAAASIDKLGEENKVIRIAFMFSVILTTVTAIFALFLIKSGLIS